MQTDVWQVLPRAEWQDSYAMLHVWMQVAGKIGADCRSAQGVNIRQGRWLAFFSARVGWLTFF